MTSYGESLHNVRHYQQMIDAAPNDHAAERFVRDHLRKVVIATETPVSVVCELAQAMLDIRKAELESEAASN